MVEQRRNAPAVIGEEGDQNPDKGDSTAVKSRHLFGDLAERYIENLRADLAEEKRCRAEEKCGREAAELARGELRERLGRLEVENEILKRDIEQKKVLEYLAAGLLSVFGAWAALGGPELPLVVPAGIVAGIVVHAGCLLTELLRRMRSRNGQ